MIQEALKRENRRQNMLIGRLLSDDRTGFTDILKDDKLKLGEPKGLIYNRIGYISFGNLRKRKKHSPTSYLKLCYWSVERIQNSTIEERVALLEIMVADIEEDVSNLDEDVDFLFEEQIIQDEKLLNLEQETEEIDEQLIEIDDDLES